VGSGVICDNIPGLMSRQRLLCRQHPDVMMSVVFGAKKGVKQCQRQFRHHRWNCSVSHTDSSVFGKLMLKGSKEAAFVYAISSAGVVHAITRACSQGRLTNCACDPTKTGSSSDRNGKFDWGGCSDNVRYGSHFARMFVDAREKRVKDARALMNLQNNRAGRRAVRRHMTLECKCHGVSGACTIRTCWLALQEFSRVGSYLKTRYDSAKQVSMNPMGTGLIATTSGGRKKTTRSDIVFFDESPDYCVQDPLAGSLGTADRECNHTSKGPHGCDVMCCGRGYDTHVVRRMRKCDCKFHWCCYVKCRECEELVKVNTCRGPNPTAAPPISNSIYARRTFT
ncbi:hypothetical protein CAPTEDRAFT_96953, partial [Capitella teleta]